MTSSSSNPIAIHCPHCLATSQVPRDCAGQRVNCQKCGRSLLVPAQSGTSTSAFDDLLEEPIKSGSIPGKQIDAGAFSENTPEAELEVFVPTDNAQAPKLTPKSLETQGNLPGGGDPFLDEPTIQIERVGGEESAFDFGDASAAQTGSVAAGDGTLELEPPFQETVQDVSVPEPVVPRGTDKAPAPIAEDEFKIELDWVPTAVGGPTNQADVGSDPFADNPDRPLKIEGLSPSFDSKETAGVRCRICDTLIYVPRAQLGQKVKCPECFSQIDAVEASQRRSSTNPFNRMMGDGVVMTTGDAPNPKDVDDDEYQLSEPVERPKVVVPESFGLGTDQRDLLMPLPPSGIAETTGAAPTVALPHKREMESTTSQPRSLAAGDSAGHPRTDSKTAGSPYWKANQERLRTPEEIERERLENDPIGMRLDDFGGTSGKMSQWLKGMSKDLELWARSGVATVGLGVAYWMVDIIWGWLKSETPPTGYQFWSLLLGLIGVMGFLAAILVLFVTGSLMFQRGTEKHPNFREWPGYGVGDWMPALSYVLPSFWLASLPGMLIGLLFTMGSGNPAFIFVFGMSSVFVLAPPLLASAVYSETYYKVIDPKMIKHFTFEDVQWLRFLPASGLAFALFVTGSLVLLIPMFIFSFLGAGLQVMAMMMFASFTGLYCRLMAEKAAEGAK